MASNPQDTLDSSILCKHNKRPCDLYCIKGALCGFHIFTDLPASLPKTQAGLTRGLLVWESLMLDLPPQVTADMHLHPPQLSACLPLTFGFFQSKQNFPFLISYVKLWQHHSAGCCSASFSPTVTQKCSPRLWIGKAQRGPFSLYLGKSFLLTAGLCFPVFGWLSARENSSGVSIACSLVAVNAPPLTGWIALLAPKVLLCGLSSSR